MNRRYGSLWTSVVTGVGFGICAGIVTLALQERLLTAELNTLALFQFQKAFNLVTLTIIVAGPLLHLLWDTVHTKWKISIPSILIFLLSAGVLAGSATLLLGIDIPWIRLGWDYITFEISVEVFFAASAVIAWLIIWRLAQNIRWPKGGVLLVIAFLTVLGINSATAARRVLARGELKTRPNILLISIDTIRADHLGFNGYHLDTTPRLDAIAAEAMQFTEVLTPISHTLPAHTSLFTGLVPNSHGVRMNGNDISRDTITLTEVLANKGYHSAAFVASVVLDHARGLARGFDIYDDDLRGKNWRAAERVRVPAQDWLQRNGDRRFFLFLHFYDTHWPYRPQAPFDTMFEPDGIELPDALFRAGHYDHSLLRKRFPDVTDEEIPAAIRRQISLYDGEVRYVDQEIGKLVDFLRQAGKWDDTLVIITGDHGESLGERGWSGHDLFYEEQIRIPLLIKPAGYNDGGRVVDQTAMLTDLTPTILDYLAQPLPGRLDGRSLVPVLRAETDSEPRTGYLERRDYPASMRVKSWSTWGLGKEFAIRKGEWKLIHKKMEENELYNLSSDPWELSNLIAEEPIVAEKLKEELLEWLGETPQVRDQDPDDMDAKTIQQLKSLGYIQ
ncbi:sulfatase [Acidobacteriota bacterium]